MAIDALSRWDSPSHTSCMHASRHQSDTTDNNYISGPEEPQTSFRFVAVCRLNFPAVAVAKASFPPKATGVSELPENGRRDSSI